MRREQREREFTEFYAASAAALRRTAYVVVRDWDVAEDLTQQASAKLYVAWPRINAETRMAYARRTVVNECLSHLRRHRPETSTETLPDVPAPYAETPRPDLERRPRGAPGPAARHRRPAVPGRPAGGRGRPAALDQRRHRQEPDLPGARDAAPAAPTPAPRGDPMTHPDGHAALATLIREDVTATEPTHALDARIPVRLGRRRLRARRIAGRRRRRGRGRGGRGRGTAGAGQRTTATSRVAATTATSWRAQVRAALEPSTGELPSVSVRYEGTAVTAGLGAEPADGISTR